MEFEDGAEGGNRTQSPLIYILLFALSVNLIIWVIEGAAGFPVESVAIGLILQINSGLRFYQEGKAEAALDRLRQLAAPLVWAVRERKHVAISSADGNSLIKLRGNVQLCAFRRTRGPKIKNRCRRKTN
ncbi:MAG: hypothetical protein ACKVQW_15655 [Pyrinomonadaceae bacterium]